MQDPEYGYCQCGCGEKTQIATMTQKACGWVKGEPKRYVFNHHRRKRVDEYYTVEDLGFRTPCWIWQGTTRDGYGRIWRDGKLHNAHRWYYEEANGPIPDGAQLDHLCRNRACVNPAHLEPVTQTINVRRGYEARGKPTHCKHGHEFTPENTLIRADGSWRCHECQKATMRRYYHRRKAAGTKPDRP